jgi:hypothetical protein
MVRAVTGAQATPVIDQRASLDGENPMETVHAAEALSGLPGAEPLFQLVSTETKPLTRELATQFATMKGSPTERERNESRCKHLRAKFLAGTLIPFNWSVAVLDGVEYRMNGQHSSGVLNDLDGGFPEADVVVLTKYDVKNKEGLAQLFRQFDDRKSSRTPVDVSGAYQGLVDQIADVPRSAAKSAIEGIAWFNDKIEGASVPSGDDKFALFNREQYHPFVRFIGELLSDNKAPELKAPAVVGGIYATFTKNEADARSFWDLVARKGDQFNDNAPTSVLDKWLVDINKGIAEIKPVQIYKGIVFAWNAARADRDIQRIKYDLRTNPEVSE